MNTHTLIHLIQSPEEVKESHLPMLEEALAIHPYFQAIRVLIAKAKGDSATIKKAAAYTSDRSVLMQIINSAFNPDINLPNIDHLDIQKDDINAFERLSSEADGNTEQDFKTTLEALSAGDLPALAKDVDFDDEFGEIEFDAPDYQVGFKDDEEETTDLDEDYQEQPSVEEETVDDHIAETPDEVTSIIEEEYISSDKNNTEDTQEEEVDADLLANIEAARKSRELFLNDESDSSASQEKEEFSQESITAPTSIEEEEEDEAIDPDLLTSLAALRKAKEEVMKLKEEAEERIASMDEDIDDTIEAIVKDEYPMEEEMEMPTPINETIEEPLFAEPEYSSNPFDNSIEEMEEKPLPQQVSEQDFTEKSKHPVQAAQASTDDDDFGIDTSLFGLDDWLEDDEVTTEKTMPAATTATTFKNSQIEQYNSEEDGMTLEEKIKAQGNIISSFIEKKPKIRPDQNVKELPENETDLSEESISQGPAFVSENLASIMVRQGKYEQAINIYKQLTLKYPDKNAYFADLIENLENK